MCIKIRTFSNWEGNRGFRPNPFLLWWCLQVLSFLSVFIEWEQNSGDSKTSGETLVHLHSGFSSRFPFRFKPDKHTLRRVSLTFFNAGQNRDMLRSSVLFDHRMKNCSLRRCFLSQQREPKEKGRRNPRPPTHMTQGPGLSTTPVWVAQSSSYCKPCVCVCVCS